MKNITSIKFTVIILTITLLITLFTAGCASNEKDLALTEEAIATFHDRLNSGNYDKIYEDAYKNLKDVQTKEEIVASLKQSREDFGKFNEIIDKRVNGVPGKPPQFRAAYVSKFEKTDATELFSFVKDDGVMKLSYYNIVKGVTDINPDKKPNQ